MIGRKFKLDIIQDYISILASKNLCSFCIRNAIFAPNEEGEVKILSELSDQLFHVYKKVMFRFGLIDLASAILDKDFLLNFNDCGEVDTLSKMQLSNKITEMNTNLKNIAFELKNKLIKMKFNQFELNYLNINSLV